MRGRQDADNGPNVEGVKGGNGGSRIAMALLRLRPQKKSNKTRENQAVGFLQGERGLYTKLKTRLVGEEEVTPPWF